MSSSATTWVADRQFRILVSTLVVLSICFSLIPLELVLHPTSPPGTQQLGAIFRSEWLPLISLSLWVLFRRFRLLLVFLPSLNPMLVITQAWLLLTALWAIDSGYVVTQSIGMLGPLMVAVVFSICSWAPGRMEMIWRGCVLAILLISLFYGLLIPKVGIESASEFTLAGSWRGITYQKNGLGQAASVALILWVNAWGRQRLSSTAAALGFVLCFFLLLKSRSSTSLVLTLLACGAQVLMLRPPLRMGRERRLIVGVGWTLGLAVIIAMVAVIASNGNSWAEGFGELFGKDATFSGRTFVWAEVIRSIHDHPWLGVGFNSFWVKPIAAPAIERLGWDCPNGHEGFLDMINELGILGFSCFLGLIAVHIRALGQLRRVDPQSGALHIVLLFYLLTANLTETGFFHPMGFTHVLLVFSSVTVSRELFEIRLRRVYGVPPASDLGLVAT